MIFPVDQKNWVFGYSWSTLLWYWCYYPHRSRDALSPVAIVFAELLTTVSPLLFLAVPVQWTFTMAFEAQPFDLQKTSFIWKIPLVFNLVVIQPWHGPCHMCSAVPSQFSSSSWMNNNHQTRLGLKAVKSKFFMLLAHKSSYPCICASFKHILVWFMSNLCISRIILMCLLWLEE